MSWESKTEEKIHNILNTYLDEYTHKLSDNIMDLIKREIEKAIKKIECQSLSGTASSITSICNKYAVLKEYGIKE